MKALNAAVAMVLIGCISGCATIMNSYYQKIGISSSPTSATVVVDDIQCGKTPTVVKMSRRSTHTFKISLPGYYPYESSITSSGVSGWIWGNIFLGGLVGLVVDLATGSIYYLTPDQVHASLQKDGIGASHQNGNLYISATLAADPSWQRVAILTPIVITK